MNEQDFSFFICGPIFYVYLTKTSYEIIKPIATIIIIRIVYEKYFYRMNCKTVFMLLEHLGLLLLCLICSMLFNECCTVQCVSVQSAVSLFCSSNYIMCICTVGYTECSINKLVRKLNLFCVQTVLKEQTTNRHSNSKIYIMFIYSTVQKYLATTIFVVLAMLLWP